MASRKSCLGGHLSSLSAVGFVACHWVGLPLPCGRAGALRRPYGHFRALTCLRGVSNPPAHTGPAAAVLLRADPLRMQHPAVSFHRIPILAPPPIPAGAELALAALSPLPDTVKSYARGYPHSRSHTKFIPVQHPLQAFERFTYTWRFRFSIARCSGVL